MGEIDDFGKKHFMSGKLINHIRTMLEEYCFGCILPIIGNEPMNFSLEYSEKEDTLAIKLSFKKNFEGLPVINDEISRAMIENVSKITYAEENDKMNIVIDLK